MKSKVYYIEDEQFLGKIVFETLETQGFEVKWETDGAKVINGFKVDHEVAVPGTREGMPVDFSRAKSHSDRAHVRTGRNCRNLKRVCLACTHFFFRLF